MRPLRKWLLPGAVVLLTASVAAAQNGFGPGGGWGRRWGASDGPIVQTEGGQIVNEDTVRTARETASHSTGTPDWTNSPGFKKDVFTFARVMYHFNNRPAPSWLGWVNDYPDSDLNLSFRLQQLTSLKVDPDGRVLKLTSPELTDFPFIYMVQPGHLGLRSDEILPLRNYLLHGGALMADDFWGTRDWDNFEGEMSRVLPGRSWVELPMDHPIFHCVFDLKRPKNDLQVPTIHFWAPGVPTYRTEDTRNVQVRAWLDDHQRIMVIAVHNSDDGDGWEREGERMDYFQAFSETRAYPLAINIIFYLMTH
jgi:hypothetical protein